MTEVKQSSQDPQEGVPKMRRVLRHLALDGTPLKGSPGLADHWFYGAYEPIQPQREERQLTLVVPTPAIERYDSAGRRQVALLVKPRG
jgi:hypothetical protein